MCKRVSVGPAHCAGMSGPRLWGFEVGQPSTRQALPPNPPKTSTLRVPLKWRGMVARFAGSGAALWDGLGAQGSGPCRPAPAGPSSDSWGGRQDCGRGQALGSWGAHAEASPGSRWGCAEGRASGLGFAALSWAESSLRDPARGRVGAKCLLSGTPAGRFSWILAWQPHGSQKIDEQGPTHGNHRPWR